jgi:hypothetical protein
MHKEKQTIATVVIMMATFVAIMFASPIALNSSNNDAIHGYAFGLCTINHPHCCADNIYCQRHNELL